ncbi:hypothetical protein K435DRAFT_212185 [Dendrothele bispora CBS 962.96]|uniref:Uncharacterized protein n=1 Tax=Dendrothele bispora (strain CBS 962.96) TaxID=1314807 RepID=A0A4S8MPF3_DENBC|nr:hypothetical protein K435DRAFT_212185 [Dendrothele bispora CBS 962.96]
MSISTGSVGSALSVRTVDTEIVDSIGNPVDGGNRREPESHMAISGSGKDRYGGIPPSSLPIPSGRNDASLYMTSGSIGGVEKHTSSEVNAGRNVDDNGERTPRKYDETVLAVIGILDAIKWQSNVAGWMKTKGVFRWKLEQSGDEREEEEGKDVPKQQLEEGEGASATLPGKQRENTKKGGDERKELEYEDEDEDDEEELEKLY